MTRFKKKIEVRAFGAIRIRRDGAWVTLHNSDMIYQTRDVKPTPTWMWHSANPDDKIIRLEVSRYSSDGELSVEDFRYCNDDALEQVLMKIEDLFRKPTALDERLEAAQQALTEALSNAAMPFDKMLAISEAIAEVNRLGVAKALADLSAKTLEG